MIRLMMIGDVVGECGCQMLTKHLWNLKKLNGADLVIVNGENSAKGNGISVSSAGAIFSAGADVITTGNHVFRKREIYRYLDDTANIVRPANYPDSAPGMGYTIVTVHKTRVCVINLLGQTFMEPLENPFLCADRLISRLSDKADLFVVDFHAEATSEKKALAVYLDARAHAVVGTHTHVQTADAHVLSGGCAFMSDLGMTGADDSILGVKKEEAVQRFVDRMPVRFVEAWDSPIVCGALITLDEEKKEALCIEPLRIEG